MEFVELKRYGYGSNFNTLFVNNIHVKKQSKNAYGDAKIQKEMLFYKYINDNNIPFCVPKIFDYKPNYYIMEYLADYKPLFCIFPHLTAEQKNNIMHTIYAQLCLLHTHNRILVSREKYIEEIQKEMYAKLKERHEEILPFVEKYSFIKYVNGIRILTFDEAINKIYDKLLTYIIQKTSFSFCIIHGDCQFNNILCNPLTHDIRFIDPRGYFGNQTLFGIQEYDYAKIKFALSGYDVFDNTEINSLDIDGNNINLDNIFLMQNVFTSSFEAFDQCTNDVITLITLSIWLGNAHCFKNNIFKTMASYYYALYYVTLYFPK